MAFIWPDVLATAIILFIIPASLAANILQIHAMNRISSFWSVSDLPVLNISVIGIIMTMYNLPVYALILIDNQQLTTGGHCSYLLLSLYLPQVLLTWGHLLMAFESYLAVVFPVFHRSHSSILVVKGAIILNGLISILGTTLFIVSSDVPYDVPLCAVYILRFGQRNMNIYLLTFVLIMVLPALTTGALYIKIGRVAHARIAPRGATPQNTFQLRRSRMMCSVFVISSLLWLPYFFYALVNNITGTKHVTALMPVLSVTNFNLLTTFFFHLGKSLRFRKKVKSIVLGWYGGKKDDVNLQVPSSIS